MVTYTLEPLPDDTALDITEVFSIDGESGWITTLRETDCEATRVYRFNVVATDHGGNAKLSSSVLVEVMVTDENDNPPKFTEEVYRGSVVENSTPYEPIVYMTTTDADVSLENRLITCYITGVFMGVCVRKFEPVCFALACLGITFVCVCQQCCFVRVCVFISVPSKEWPLSYEDVNEVK